ncbi:hypothetical protein PHYBOEH_000886 [Phytophthora boehmeriae]|uniref:Uncharacterized protein n=1 Tax=Phytophthora boehmeriae TaxID=109152 RepID=A0A8T1VAU7_9STRA|nr:hypothetical protein PHYBOEH_000886 [Phytophthora boehmeriae]
MSVSDRTRKRTQKEPQNIQNSPEQPPSRNKQVRSAKAGRSEQRPITSAPQVKSGQPTQSASAVGKKRRRAEVPADDSKVALRLKKKLQEEYDAKRKVLVETIAEQKQDFDKMNSELTETKEQLEEKVKDLATLQLEHEALKSTHEKELAALKTQALADAATAKKQLDDQSKSYNELREEHEGLKKVLEHVLIDPETPHQVRTIVQLDAKILELERQLKVRRDEVVLENQSDFVGSVLSRSETTPPPKKTLAVDIERKKLAIHQLIIIQQKRYQVSQKREQIRQEMERLNQEAGKMDQAEFELTQEEGKLAEDALETRILSGSSQSQDSIDAGRLRGSRRSSHGGASNEHSEPSPSDISQTFDSIEESKGDDAAPPIGGSPIFTIYGIRRADVDSATRPTTLSQPQMFRTLPPRRDSPEEEKKANE